MQMSLKLIWLLQLISKARKKKKKKSHCTFESHPTSGQGNCHLWEPEVRAVMSCLTQTRLWHLTGFALSFQDGHLGPEPRYISDIFGMVWAARKPKVTLGCLSNLAAKLGHIIPTSIFSLVNYFRPKVQLHLITLWLTFVSATGSYKCESSKFSNYQRKRDTR